MRRYISIFLAALSLCSIIAPASAADRRKVIVDQDAFEGPGLQPILMLLQDPNVEVLGITTVSGDGWQAEETSATLRMLELIGRTDVPVYAGATFPLINSKARMIRREALYGKLAYKGAWTDTWPEGNTMVRRKPHGPFEIPALKEGSPSIRAAPGSAADFLIAMTRKYPGQITIIAMGPLTNLALAQRLDDGFAGRVKELVTEGGSLQNGETFAKQDEFAAQIAFAPRMSFNHYWDPEASHIVFTSPWPKFTLITDDASKGNIADRALIDKAVASDHPVARYVRTTAQAGFPLWDETQVAAWLDPGIVTHRATLAMDVDLARGANYGALLIWPASKGPGLGERDVDVIYSVDKQRVRDLFVDLLNR